MKMQTLSLELSRRSVKGKAVKRLRRAGIVPVHYYGHATEPLALQVEAGALRRLLLRAGANIPIAVGIDGQDSENICFIREVQRHPVTEETLHVDFMRVDVSRALTAEVPVILDGEPEAVRELGGTLLQPFHTLAVEALPLNMPEAIHVDVSGLDDFEKVIRIGEIPVPEGATILRDPDEMIARVLAPRLEEAAVTEEGAVVAEGLEGEKPEEEPEETDEA